MTPARPRVIILLGPNGAGKSTVGRMLANRFAWKYISLEEFFMAQYMSFDVYSANRHAAYQAFEAHVRAALVLPSTTVVFEEVGLSDDAQQLIAGLQSDYEVRLVKLTAGVATCIQRVSARGLANNFPKTPESVAVVHARFNAEAIPRYLFDLCVDNDNLPTDKICEQFEPLAGDREN